MGGSVLIVGKDKHEELHEVRLSSEYIHALSTINHKEIMQSDGYMYQASIELTVTNAATMYVLGIVPSGDVKIKMTERKVFCYVASGGVDIEIELIRDVTSATTEGNITPRNANHNLCGDCATFLIHDDPATVTGGDTMPGKMAFKTTNQSASAGGTAAGAYEMKSGSKYALKVVNGGSNAVTVLIAWEWVEIAED